MVRDEDDSAAQDNAWSSEGLVRNQAIRQWHDHWSARRPTPIKISLHDPEGFTARWVHFGIGPLRLLRILAPAQSLTNPSASSPGGSSNHLIHLIYSLSGNLEGETNEKQFVLRPGHFILLDNLDGYELEMKTPHEVIDLIVPSNWMDRHMADPRDLLGQPISMKTGWAPPLGLLLETLTLRMESCPVPRSMLAEKIGALLSLATAEHDAPLGSQRTNLTWRIMHRIEADFADPELSPDRVASDLRISKRYLQSLLAKAGTSFVQELNTTRLDRASVLLSERETQGLPISEIAYRCGFLDPGYFTRLFRKRFSMAPRDWRGPR